VNFPGCVISQRAPTKKDIDDLVFGLENGVDYVALSYRDNRFSFAIHAFAADGTLRGLREEVGARYLSAIQIDGEARVVAFVGQAERSVLLGWDSLQQIR
jgi:hypothetical protein